MLVSIGVQRAQEESICSCQIGQLCLPAWPAFRCTPCPLSAPSHSCENLRAAAEELHLTHSAVSQQIRVLEEQLGFELFERRGRRIVLNPAGAALLRSVEPALTSSTRRAAAAAAAAGAAQRLRVTRAAVVRAALAAAAHGRWRERHPDSSRSRSMRRSRWSICSAKAFTPRCGRAAARGAGCRPSG